MGRKKFASFFMAACMLFSVVFPQNIGAAEVAGGAAVVIDVKEYLQAHPLADEQKFSDGREDYAVAIQNLLAEAKSRQSEGPVEIRFEAGKTYDIYPDRAAQRELYVSNTVGTNQNHKDKKIGFLLEGMKDVTINGNGAKFMFHGKMTTFATIDSTNITFENYEFDFKVPTVVDITVESVDTDAKQAVVYVPESYNYQISGTTVKWQSDISPYDGNRYWETTGAMDYTQRHDFNTGLTWRGTTGSNPVFSSVSSIEDIGNRRLRFTYSSLSTELREGLCLQMRNTVRDHPGMFFWKSKDVALKNMDVRFLHGFGIVGQNTENVTLDGVIFEAPENTKRTTVGYADFIQMSGCKGEVRIQNCSFANPHDDPINVHGTFMQVVSVDIYQKKVTVEFKHNETAGFPNYFVGDEVEFVAKSTLNPVASSAPITVVAVDGPDGKGGKGTGNSLTRATLTLSSIPEGVTSNTHVLENVTYTPSVVIQDNIFKETPTRGILVTTRRKVVIKGNQFDGMGMASIYISDDANGWYESGAVSDVTIEKNTFTRPAAGYAAIFIEPTNTTIGNPVHKNITISDNTFYMQNGEAVNAKSTDGLTISGNKIYRYKPVSLSLAPLGILREGDMADLQADASWNANSSKLYSFNGCKNVSLDSNTYDGGLNLRADKSNMQDDGPDISDAGVGIATDNIKDAALNTAIRYEVVSGKDVVSVSDAGTVTALAKGKAEIAAYVEVNGKKYSSAKMEVNVLEAVVPAHDTRLRAVTIPDKDKAVMDQSFDREITDYVIYLKDAAAAFDFAAMESEAAIEVFADDAQVKTGTGTVSGVTVPAKTNNLYVRVTSKKATKAKTYVFRIISETEEKYLSDMSYKSAANGWDASHPIRMNQTVNGTGTKLSLLIDGQDKQFDKGIGGHASCNIVYDLTGKDAVGFSTWVGLDQESKNEQYGDAAFSIYGDGKRLWGPVTISRGQEAQFVELSILGIRELKLEADQLANNWSDHVDFADAKVVVEKKKVQTPPTLYLSDIDYVAGESSVGDAGNNRPVVSKDRSTGDNPLRLKKEDGTTQEFEKGIGSHATCRIVYNIEGLGYKKFSTYVGIDREITNTNEPSATFNIYGDGLLKSSSKEMVFDDAMQLLEVDVTNVKKLKLEANAGTNEWSDHVDFADAKLTDLAEPPAVVKHMVRYSAQPKAGGTVTAISGDTTNETGFFSVDSQASVTLTAAAAEGYVFKGWYEGETERTKELSHAVASVGKDCVLTAVFEPAKKSELTAAVASNQVVSEEALSGYVSSAAAKYRSALAAANKALAKTEIDKEEMAEALQNLAAAKEGLEAAKKGDFADFRTKLDTAKALDLTGYKEEGAAVYRQKCEAAETLCQSGDATQQQINDALLEIETAKNAMQQKETGSEENGSTGGNTGGNTGGGTGQNPDQKPGGTQGGQQQTPAAVPAAGTQFSDGVLTYSVTLSDAAAGTVSVVGFAAEKASVEIPASVEKDGYKFAVTEIGKDAFRQKKVSAVIIGENIKTIGENAFAKCNKLKKLTFKGANAPSMKGKVFSGCKIKTVYMAKSMKSSQQKRLKSGLKKAGAKVTKYQKAKK